MLRKTDYSGQWILLMAVIAGVGMAVLLVFVNQSVMAGYASSGSIMDFPKNDLREIRSEVVNEAFVLGTTANKDQLTYDDRVIQFKQDFLVFKDDIEHMYARKGVVLVVWHDELEDVDNSHAVADELKEISLHIEYNDGRTTFTENTVVYL